MKWLFIFLLVTNIVYFGWELDQESKLQAKNAQSLPLTPAFARRLQLLSEMDELPALQQATESIAKVESKITNLTQTDISLEFDEISSFNGEGSVEESDTIAQLTELCYRYGPITEDDKFQQLKDLFQNYGLQMQTKEEYDEEGAFFWIYLEPEEDRQQASATVKKLVDKGVKDYRIIKKGVFENAISLGLFSSKERVDIRLKELNSKGYYPVVVPYHDGRVKRIYWVDVLFNSLIDDIDSISANLAAEYSVQQVNCSDVALVSVNP